MDQAVELLAEPVVITKDDVLTEPYLKVMYSYFINLSAFRRFIVNTYTHKELKYKLKGHLSRYNDIYALKRPPAQLQADSLVLFKMADTLLNNDGV